MTTKRAGGLPLYEAQQKSRGLPVAKGLCRECGHEVPPGRRRTWCSDRCVDAHALRTNPGFQRRAVLARDKGICAACGVDCIDLARRIRPLRSVPHGVQCRILEDLDYEPNWWPDYLPSIEAVRRAVEAYLTQVPEPDRNGYRRNLDRKSWFDVDHVMPLVDGGTNDLAGLQTLCRSCHKAKSAGEASARAKTRREP